MWRRYALPALIFLAVFAVIGVAAYVVGLAAIGRGVPNAYPWAWTPEAGPLLDPPLTPFAPIDPAVGDLLAYHQGRYDVEPLRVQAGVIPVGAYLPRMGNMQFTIPTSTPLPTLVPLPTSPLIEQSEDEGILPTRTSPLGGPPPVPYAGDGCAPHGLPVSGLLTQRFHAWHSGIDLGVPVGTPVTATHSGQVIFASWSTVGYGNLVILQNGSFITYYAHLSAFNVVVDQFVGAGSIIAWTGNTGNSTGPHIHYETRVNNVPVDPLTFDNRGYRSC